MLNVNIEIPDDFLKEEIRCDYLVSEKMKKVWAVEMDMLNEVDRICKKYGLTYFADSGTLIGAIRHGGFIPWDDDIDLAMLRRDYERFCRIAPKELKYPIKLQTVYTDNKNVRGFAKLRNSETTALTAHDRVKDYNFGIFIDIFPMDRVPDNKIVFKLWTKRIKTIKHILDAAVYRDLSVYKSYIHKALWLFCSLYVRFFGGYKGAFRHYEKVCMKFNRKKTKRVSYVAHSHGKEKHLWDINCFKSSHYVPFEFTMINIPDGYDSRLTTEYGDYMTPAKAPQNHVDMVLEPEIPYREYFKEHSLDELRSK